MLIIFDCDGVLVESEDLAADVFSKCLAQYAILLTPQQCFDIFHGKTLPHCFSWIEQKFQTKLPPNFGEYLAQETTARFARDLQPVAGVEYLLQSLLEREIAFCLASNGEHKKINNSLNIAGLAHYFPQSNNRICRFSREDVLNGKPAPDLFLHAAKATGYAPQECVVVEDSNSGFEAAKAAGMTLIKYLPRHTRKSGSNVCRTMEEVAAFLSAF